MNKEAITGSVPSIIRNKSQEIYPGNLEHYFRAVFNKAENLRNPYHNFRHLCHVLYLCYKACIFYKEELTPRQCRNLLIAAMFHDFDHTGTFGPDIVNIGKAVAGLVVNILPEDEEYMTEIIRLIQTTEYPYKSNGTEDITLSAQILRDADQSQALSIAWIQQVIFGLSEEWKKTPLQVLEMQEPFHRNLVFSTEWAKSEFPEDLINSKVSESRELIEILKEKE